MRRVLVTGARGYLASLAQLYNAGRYEFVRVSHTDVDFRDPAGVERFFGEAEFACTWRPTPRPLTASRIPRARIA